MIVCCKPDHSDHEQAFTTLLQTALKHNMKFHYDKLQYKKDEVGETLTTSHCKLIKDKV